MLEKLNLDPNLYKIGGTPTGDDLSAPQTLETPSESVYSGDIIGNTNVIDGFLQSKNFVSGTTGWRIDADGSAEFLDATIVGSITATTGFIGGWTIGTTSFTDTAGTVGLSSAVTAGDDIRFWAGDTTPASAEFKVTEAGILTATSATITGAITISSGSGIANLTDAGALAVADTADFDTEVSGAEKPANNATVGADWSVDLSNIPGTLGTPGADGLYLTSTYMGYYKSSAWTSYIRNNGDFYFAGDAGSSIDWNVTTGSTLTIKGKINAGTGSVLDGTYITAGTVISSKTSIAIQDWTHDLVFSADGNVKVDWATGTIALSDGSTTYAIDAGDTTARLTAASKTSPMASITYIYLDTDTSSTVLQASDTYSDAIGDNKILIAVAEDVAADKEATFQVYNGIGGIGTLLTTANLAANCVTANLVGANEIIANTANLANLVVTSGKINDLAVSKLTAGTIDSQTITLASASSDAYIATGKTDFTNTDSGFILGTDFSDASKAKFYIGDATTYLNWTGTDLVVKAGTGSSIDFSYVTGVTKPDDNATLGATFGTDIAGGGTSNTQTANDGYTTLFRQDKFADGDDGDVTISSDTTLTADMYYNNLTVNNTFT